MSKEKLNMEEITSKKEVENKKENSKAGKSLIVFMVISGFVGFILGIVMSFVSKYYAFADIDLTDLFGGILTSALGESSVYIISAIAVFLTAYVSYSYKSAKKAYAAAENLDEYAFEEAYNKIDSKLNTQMSVATICFILAYMLFSIHFYYSIHMKVSTVTLMISIIAFILVIFVHTIYQQKCVDLFKVMNPEKKGSVYDMKFKDKWLESCDEAERLAIYQCGYKAFKVTNGWCLGLWLLFTLGGIIFHYSMMPVIIVSIIWLVLTISYFLEGKKLEKK